MKLKKDIPPAKYNNCFAGIAVAPILFIVALLSVLVAAISSGSGGFTSNTGNERTRIATTQILNTAHTIKQAVDRVRGHGCADNQISFENSVVSGYTNTNSPIASSPECHVFQPQGGGVTWPMRPPSLSLTASPQSNWYIQVVDNGASLVSPVAGDIILYLSFRELDVCLEINRILGGGLPTDFANLGQNNPCGQIANGSLVGVCQQPHCGLANRIPFCPPYQTALAGCMLNDGSPGDYFFFYTLVRR